MGVCLADFLCHLQIALKERTQSGQFPSGNSRYLHGSLPEALLKLFILSSSDHTCVPEFSENKQLSRAVNVRSAIEAAKMNTSGHLIIHVQWSSLLEKPFSFYDLPD